jgi:O-antigen/teichoic acid export membrane protein
MSTNENETTEKHSKKNIFFGTIVGYLTFILNVVAGILFTRWIINSIGDSNYAVYGLTNSIITTLSFDFGLGWTTYTFLSKYRAEGNQEAINHLLGLMYKIYFVIAATLFAVLFCYYFCIPYIYTGLTVGEIGNFQNAYIITGIFAVVSFPAGLFSETINAYEEYIWAKVIQLINKLVYIILTIVALYLGWGLLGLVGVNAISGLVTAILRWVIVKKRTTTKPDFRYKPSKKTINEIIAFTFWTAIATIFQRLSLTFIPNILGIVSNSDNIAVFNIANALEVYVFTFSSIMGTFFLPKVSRIYKSDKPNKTEILTKTATFVGKIQIVLFALVFVGFVSCGKEFIVIWTGKSLYQNSYYVAIFIISAFIVSIPESVLNTAMYTNHKVKHLAISVGCGVAVTLALAFGLGYIWGAVGAGLGYFCGKIIELILTNLYYKKDLHINIWSFLKHVFSRPMIPATISLTLGLLLHFFLPFGLLSKFLIIGFSVVLIYVPLSLLFSFSSQEKKDIKTILHIKKKETGIN